MNERCAAFRAEWLSAGFDPVHVEECEACRAWVRASERSIQALEELRAAEAPGELERRVVRELSGDRVRRLERAVGSLARLGAPAALDGLVHRRLAGRAPAGDAERGERSAQVLRTLDLVPAPAVLDRLVQEELAAPARQTAERFPGNLERLRAPDALAEALHARARRQTFVRLARGPFAVLVAAALVVWLALRFDEPAPRAYRFEVVRADSLEGLDPLARALAESLTGGVAR